MKSQKKNLTLLSFLAAAFIVNAQNVGIGTITPRARLHVTDSSVIFSAADPLLALPGNTPISGTGARMMWYPGKAAFRTGFIDGTQWDKDNIGFYSFASGYSTKANNLYSTAMGRNTIATGTSSTALGYFTVASGSSSTAFGSYNQATGSEATAMNSNTIASGFAATAMGFGTNAKGDYSVALGSYTKSKSPSSVVMGLYNDTTNTNRIFEIGNGTADNARRNAVTVLTNGNVGIGIINPEFPLDINGRMRLSGTNPVPGIWLNAAGIDGAFVGLQNDDHVGFYGGNGGVGWGLTMNTQTGAVEINGNPGIAGQILQSNGSGSSPVWIDAANLKTKYYQRDVLFSLPNGGSVSINIPVTVYTNSIITTSVTVNLNIGSFSGCTDGNLSITQERVGGGNIITPMGNFNYPCGKPNYTISTGEISVLNSSGDMNISSPGNELINIKFSHITGPSLLIGNTSPAKILIKVTPI